MDIRYIRPPHCRQVITLVRHQRKDRWAKAELERLKRHDEKVAADAGGEGKTVSCGFHSHLVGGLEHFLFSHILGF